MRHFRTLSAVAALLFPPTLAAGQPATLPQSFQSDGVAIRYVVRGTGPAVLLVHGFSVNAALNWVAPGVVDSLATSYTVIAPDLRGHGSSDKPHDASAYGKPFVDDLVRLLDHLQLTRVHVVGYSMGGIIALNLLVRHPERVMSAVIGGAGWRSPEMGAPERVVRWEQQMGRAVSGEATIMEILAEPGAPAPPPPVAAVMNANDPVALRAVLRGNASLAVTEQELRTSTIPVLVLVGDQDWALADAERAAALLGNAQLQRIPGADHLGALMFPQFIGGIKRFLAAR